MLAHLTDGSARTIARAATLRENLQTKLSISPKMLTPGQRQAPRKVASRVPMFKSLVTRPGKKRSAAKAGIPPRSAAVEGGRFTTRPTRRLIKQASKQASKQGRTSMWDQQAARVEGTGGESPSTLGICIHIYTVPRPVGNLPITVTLRIDRSPNPRVRNVARPCH